MAISSSKTKELSSVNGSTTYKLQISFKENSTNISTNKSNITVTGKLSCNGGYWSTSYNSKIQLYWHDNKNNSDQLIKTYEFAGLSSKNDTKSVSKTIDVAHNNDGSLKGYAKAVFTKGSTTTGWAPQNGNVSTSNTALTNIPRQATLTSATDFTDEGNPTIYYKNSAGNSVTELKAGIYDNNGSVCFASYRDVPKTGTSYTFSLTEEERTALRNATPNSSQLAVRIYLRTLISGNYYYSYLVVYMNIVNGYPTFTDFTYYDDSDIAIVTGDSTKLVKGYSNLKVSIPSANKMVANKGASPSQYVATVDDKNVNVAYSDNDILIDLGTLNTVGKKDLWVKAYDSRQSWYGLIKHPYVYDYEKPVVNATIKRTNDYENETTLKVSGTYSLLTINNENKNRITFTMYRYRETGGTWSSWDFLTRTSQVNDGTFTCNDLILSLDNTKSFEFQIQVADKITSTYVDLSVDEGNFIFFVSTNTKKCYNNGVVLPTLDMIYPVGSIYMSINNTNPSTLFGGTWEQIQGRFLLGAGNNGASGNEALNTNAGATGGETNHTLNTSEIPSHYHEADEVNHMFLTSNGNIALNSTKRAWWTNQGTADKHFVYTSVDNLGISEHRNTTSTGGGGAHNNLPPYLSVYIWKRTA